MEGVNEMISDGIDKHIRLLYSIMQIRVLACPEAEGL